MTSTLPEREVDLFGRLPEDYFFPVVDACADALSQKRFTGDRVRDHNAILYRAVVALSPFHTQDEIAGLLSCSPGTVAVIQHHEHARVVVGKKDAAVMLKSRGLAVLMSACRDADKVTPEKRAMIGGITFDKGLALETAAGMDGGEGENVLQIESGGEDARSKVAKLLGFSPGGSAPAAGRIDGSSAGVVHDVPASQCLPGGDAVGAAGTEVLPAGETGVPGDATGGGDRDQSRVIGAAAEGGRGGSAACDGGGMPMRLARRGNSGKGVPDVSEEARGASVVSESDPVSSS